MDFQKRVIKYLKKQGFDIAESSFPNIIAWKPLEDNDGNFIKINTFQNIKGEESIKVLNPYFICYIQCKENQNLTKQEKTNAKKSIEQNKCNSFFVAYKNKKNILFSEIFSNLTIKKPKITLPSYLG